MRTSVASQSTILQTAYTIDPVSGSDAYNGTASQPLKTLRELGRRLSGIELTTSIAVTLLSSSLADDRLELVASSARAGVELTISGVPTTAQSDIPIAAVSALAASGNSVWQLTTTGVVWTSVTQQRLLLSNGRVLHITQVIDADNIVVAGSVDDVGAVSAPTTAMTLSIQSVPTVNGPLLEMQPAKNGTVSPFFSLGNSAVRLKDVAVLSVDVNGYSTRLIAPARFEGCSFSLGLRDKIAGPASDVVMTNCLFNVTAACAVSLQQLLTAGCAFVGDAGTRTFRVFTNCWVESAAFFRCRIRVNGKAVVNFGSDAYFTTTQNPIEVLGGGLCTCSNNPPNGSSGNTGHGVDLDPAAILTFQSGTPPTVTGATGDLNLAGATTAWGSTPIFSATTGAGAVEG